MVPFATTIKDEGEVLCPEVSESTLSNNDKVFVLLSNMIKELAKNMNEQYLVLAKQIKKADEKIFTIAQEVVKKQLIPLHENVNSFQLEV